MLYRFWLDKSGISHLVLWFNLDHLLCEWWSDLKLNIVFYCSVNKLLFESYKLFRKSKNLSSNYFGCFIKIHDIIQLKYQGNTFEHLPCLLTELRPLTPNPLTNIYIYILAQMMNTLLARKYSVWIFFSYTLYVFQRNTFKLF